MVISQSLGQSESAESYARYLLRQDWECARNYLSREIVSLRDTLLHSAAVCPDPDELVRIERTVAALEKWWGDIL